MSAHQAPPYLGFSRQEHWSGLPFPSPMHESEKVKVQSLSRVRLLATPWTAAHQAPPSMGFARQEYWSGVPLPSPLQIPRVSQRSDFSKIWPKTRFRGITSHRIWLTRSYWGPWIGIFQQPPVPTPSKWSLELTLTNTSPRVLISMAFDQCCVHSFTQQWPAVSRLSLKGQINFTWALPSRN